MIFREKLVVAGVDIAFKPRTGSFGQSEVGLNELVKLAAVVRVVIVSPGIRVAIKLEARRRTKGFVRGADGIVNHRLDPLGFRNNNHHSH